MPLLPALALLLPLAWMPRGSFSLSQAEISQKRAWLVQQVAIRSQAPRCAERAPWILQRPPAHVLTTASRSGAHPVQPPGEVAQSQGSQSGALSSESLREQGRGHGGPSAPVLGQGPCLARPSPQPTGHLTGEAFSRWELALAH